jgi:hypothetical protein
MPPFLLSPSLVRQPYLPISSYLITGPLIYPGSVPLSPVTIDPDQRLRSEGSRSLQSRAAYRDNLNRVCTPRTIFGRCPIPDHLDVRNSHSRKTVDRQDLSYGFYQRVRDSSPPCHTRVPHTWGTVGQQAHTV